MMAEPIYRELPIPEGLPIWRIKEIDRLREWFRTQTYEKDGVLRWTSNDRCVPESSFRDAACVPPAANPETERRENEESLARYRASPPRYSEEALAEMRSEFGPGSTVVDILSGRRTKL